MTSHACTIHRPGSRQCHVTHGCNCAECLKASYTYSKLARLRALRGQVNRPACGAQRRLQALMALGWSLVELGERLGRSRPAMTDLLRQVDHVQWATYTAVRDLYDDLWDTRPPEDTADQRRAATRARRRAQREGWAPPMAWDDGAGPHGIDNPHATPVLGSEPRTMGPRPSVRVEDVEWLASCGATADGIAHQLGVKRATLLGKLRDAGCDDLLERLERKVA